MAKETVNLEKPVEEEEIFASCTSDRGLVFRITLTNNFYKMKLEKPHKQTTQLKVSYGIELKNFSTWYKDDPTKSFSSSGYIA